MLGYTNMKHMMCAGGTLPQASRGLLVSAPPLHITQSKIYPLPKVRPISLMLKQMDYFFIFYYLFQASFEAYRKEVGRNRS